MALLCMGFRYLATAHYGIAVAALTGTVVILLSFEGVAPGAAVIDRVINTALGCGMACWPTWRGRPGSANAPARSSRTCSMPMPTICAALARPAARAPIARHARQPARRAPMRRPRLERMRSEPATPPRC